MSLIRRGAQQIATLASPVIRACGGVRALNALTTYAHVLNGQGAGSGWDSRSETATVAGLVDAPMPTVLDVGANNGKWSLSLAIALNRESEFHLFEVAPFCFPDLERRASEIKSARIIKKAVSDSDGYVDFYIPSLGIGNGLGSIHERRDVGVPQTEYNKIQVPTLTIDGYCKDLDINTVDLLKMDIEGHELQALKGAQNLLSNQNIRVVTFEFGSANVNSRTYFRDFWEFFNDFGYHLHRMMPGGGAVSVKKYTEDLEYFRGATNYIAKLI